MLATNDQGNITVVENHENQNRIRESFNNASSLTEEEMAPEHLNYERIQDSRRKSGQPQ